MFVSNVVNGLVIGFPLMLAVGPIAILLLDQGLERGTRAALPAAVGVASADLSFSVLAAVAGTSIALFLTPITPVLSMAAVALLLFLAVRLFRTATAELRALRAGPVASAAGAGSVFEPWMAGAGETWEYTGGIAAFGWDEPLPEASMENPARSTVTLLADGAAADSPDAAGPAIPFGQLRGLRLGAAFFGLTAVNPLTIVLFAAVVVAGGAGAGTPGWAVGVALSSLIVHSGWVFLGGALGATIGPVATARMRLTASVLMAGLALHFLLG